MDTFRENYLESCNDLNVEPNHTILEKLQIRALQDGNDGRIYPDTLNLSGISLSAKTVTALAAAIKDDVVFTRLNVADAFLGDDGAILLASALKTNTTLKELDMRGNNIRHDGAVALSQMLKVNSTLETLKLEWNCVGVWDSGIKGIADALAVNNHLKDLDLRNNKVGSAGVQVLAQSLKHNHGLTSLDLRWNNAGVSGGRALVDMLKWNHTIRDVELSGNEVPEDILRAVESQLSRNRSEYSSRTNQAIRDTHLNATIQALTKQHQETLAGLQSKLQVSDSQVGEMARQLTHASEEINSSQSGYRVLESKYDRLLKEKQLAEELVLKERSSFNGKVGELQSAMERERERRGRLEEEHREVIEKMTRRNLEVEAGFRELDTKNELLKRDKKALLEEVDILKDRETRLLRINDEKLEQAQANFDRKVHALEQQREKDLAEKSQSFEFRLKAVEQQKQKLEEELDNQRNRYLNQKREWEILQLELEKKIKQEEDVRRRDLVNSVHSLEQQLVAAQQQHQQELRQSEQRVNRAVEREQKLQSEITQLKTWLAKFPEPQELERLRDVECELENVNRERAQDLERVRLMESLILHLKDEVRRYRSDLETLREGEVVKMKEIELAISNVLQPSSPVKTKPRHKSRQRSQSPDRSLLDTATRELAL